MWKARGAGRRGDGGGGVKGEIMHFPVLRYSSELESSSVDSYQSCLLTAETRTGAWKNMDRYFTVLVPLLTPPPPPPTTPSLCVSHL